MTSDQGKTKKTQQRSKRVKRTEPQCPDTTQDRLLGPFSNSSPSIIHPRIPLWYSLCPHPHHIVDAARPDRYPPSATSSTYRPRSFSEALQRLGCGTELGRPGQIHYTRESGRQGSRRLDRTLTSVYRLFPRGEGQARRETRSSLITNIPDEQDGHNI